jgi:DNA repair protein RadC
MIANQEELFKLEHTAPAPKMRFAYSIKTTRVKEPDFPYNGQQISCTRDVVTFAAQLRNADIEKMVVLYLDAQNKIAGIQVMTGTINQCFIYPREVFRHALLNGACAIILVHNHPSGSTKPSECDVRLTKTLTEAGKIFEIAVHDHFIIGGDGWFSMREAGMI